MFYRDRTLTKTLAANLLLEEYRTLRAEAHQALAYAQGIVRWTVAIYGAVLAAALVAAREAGDAVGYTFMSTSLLILFGFALPGVTWAAAWTWLGELIRMERAGGYLRGLELQIQQFGHASLGFAPLRWESFIHAENKKPLTEAGKDKPERSLFGKSKSAYLGTAAMFFGATLLPVVLFFFWWGHMFGWDWGGLLWLWLLGAGLFEFVGGGVSFLLFWRLNSMGRALAEIPRWFASA